jgi:hypothetical protein
MRCRIGFIGLLGILALFAACDEECVTEPTGSQTPDTTAIFPLAVGNKWIYDNAARSDSVTASTVLDGKTYHILQGRSLYFREPVYVRMNDQQQLVVRHEVEPLSEYVLLDFGADPGDSWPCFFPDCDTLSWGKMGLIRRSDSLTVAAGTFRDCYFFGYFPVVTDSGLRWWVAPGTGIVKIGFVTEPGVDLYELVEFVEAVE